MSPRKFRKSCRTSSASVEAADRVALHNPEGAVFAQQRLGEETSWRGPANTGAKTDKMVAITRKGATEGNIFRVASRGAIERKNWLLMMEKRVAMKRYGIALIYALARGFFTQWKELSACWEGGDERDLATLGKRQPESLNHGRKCQNPRKS